MSQQIFPNPNYGDISLINDPNEDPNAPNYNPLNSGDFINSEIFTNVDEGTIIIESGSIFQNPGTVTDGNLSIASEATFDNSGTVTAYIYNYGTVTNESGGTIAPLDTDSEIEGSLENESGATFDNYGTATVYQIDNYGTVTNESSGTIEGVLYNENGATFDNYGTATAYYIYNYGTVTNESSRTIESGGTIGIGEPEYPLDNESGATFDNSGTVTAYYIFNSGTLTNESGGTIEGVLTNESGASFDNYGTVTAYSISNSGTLTNESGGTIKGVLGNGDGGSIENESGTFDNYGTVTAYSIYNYGTLTNENGGTIEGSSLANESGTFDNYGTVTANIGNSGIVTNESGGTIEGSLGNVSTFDNYGTVTASPIDNSDTLTVDNYGTVTNESGGTIEGSSLENESGATFDNYGTVTADIGNSGIVTNESGGTIEGSLGNVSTFDNYGTVTASPIDNSDTLTVDNYGTVTNESGGTIEGSSLENESGATFDNYGTVTNESGGTIEGSLTNYSGATFDNYGTLTASSIDNSGTLIDENGGEIVDDSNNFNNTNTGILAGTGTFVGNLTIGDGILEPGGTLSNGSLVATDGTFTVEGDFSLTGGALDISVDGVNSGEFDVLSVTDTASLTGGTINFSINEVALENELPATNTDSASITFLTTTNGISVTSAYLKSITPANTSNFDYSVTQVNNSLVLNITNSIKPDPSPIKVSLVSGTESEENGMEVLDGTIDLGRTDGTDAMLQVQGQVEYDDDTVSVNGTVYSLIGTGNFLTNPLFTGSFSIDTKTGVASSITNTGSPFDLGGEVNVQFNSLTLNQNEVALGAQFNLSQDTGLSGYTFNGLDAIIISGDNVSFGTSIELSLPDLKNFNLFNFIPVEEFSDFSIEYIAPQDLIKIQAKLVLAPIAKQQNTQVIADFSGENYVQIQGGKLDVVGDLTLKNLKLTNGWSINEATLSIDTVDETIDGEAIVTFPFGEKLPPTNVSVGLDLQFNLPIPPLELNAIEVSVGNEDNPLNIPIAGTGAFLQTISGSIEHISSSDPDPIEFTGETEVTAGPKVTVDLSKFNLGKFTGVLIDADVTGTISNEDLAGSLNLTLVNSQLAQINGNFDLNWDNNLLTVSGNVSFINGLITGQGGFKATSNYDIVMFGTANITVPSFVPLIHGQTLASGSYLFDYTNDNNYSDDFIEAWGTIGIHVLGQDFSYTGGFKYSFDGTYESIGSENLPTLPTVNSDAIPLTADGVSNPNLLNAASAALDTSGNSFVVAPGTPWIILGADWDNPNNNVQLQLQDPNGNIYNESDFAGTGNIAIVDQLSQSTSRAVLINNPDPGTWTIDLANSTGLGNVTFSGYANSQSPTIQVTDPSTDTSNQNVTIVYNTVDPNPNGQVSLFYNTDNTDYNGILIQGGITEQDGSNSFVWNTQGIATGNYYVYAMLLDSSNIPVFSYAPGVVDVTEQADLSVTDTASTDQVTLENSLTYTITVSNNGPNTSQGVVLTDNLPQNVTFISSSIQPSTQSGNNLTFNLGNLENGQSASINITVNPEAIGDITNTASVSSNTFDGDASNSSDNFVTTVLNNPTNPNTITNLSGYGTPHWITGNTALPYTVNFSNDAALGSTPVAQVTITEKLDPNLNLSTFQLSNFGFEGNTYVVPAGLQNYSTQIDLTSTKGIFVDVTAGLNTTNGTVTWTFTSIDPTTGQPITDPTKGFLPPEDQTGSGSGYVGYTIQPNANVADSTVINAQATITFDNQTPIQTASVFNTVEENPPSSSVNALPTDSNPNFTVSWTGSDADSGIASYNIYVSTNGGQYTLWQNNTTATSATFNGEAGNTYAFYSEATDNAGLTEAAHTSADATTTISTLNIPPVANSDTYTATENQTLTVNAANGVLANDTDPNNLPLTATLVNQPSNGTITFNNDGSFTYTPNTGYTGTDTFTYQAVDQNNLDSSPATVTIQTLGLSSTNSISNPTGYGSQQWVVGNAALPYTVNFSNSSPQGTNPVDQVTITEQLDPNLDLSTFQLGNFGFGGNTYNVPTGDQNYSTQIDISSTLDVDVTAGLNTATGVVTWTFTAIDPTTGQPVTDPTQGFLPPNNNGSGNGFVSYTIQPNANIADGTVVDAQATITFDNQTPIQTASVFNTIEENPPTSSVNALPTTESSPNFTVSWTGSDADSGIAYYNIYVSTNGGQYTLWQNQTTATSATYDGLVGDTYAFYSVATDNIGLTEAAHNTFDTETTVVNNNQPIRTAGNLNNLTVLANSGLTSLGLTGLAYASGGGSNEQNQTLIYTVTTIPNPTLGTIYLADGTTPVTANNTYTLQQIQGFEFQPTRNSSGSGELSFAVADNGSTANGGQNTLTQSLNINVNNVVSADTQTLTNIPNSDVFQVNNSNAAQGLLLATITGFNSQSVDELGVFRVDASGNIIDATGNVVAASGAANYTQAALENGQVLLSAITNSPNGYSNSDINSYLQLPSGSNLRFYLVQNSTTNNVLAGNTPTNDVLFLNSANQQIQGSGTNSYNLNWNDSSTGSPQNLVVNVQPASGPVPLGADLQISKDLDVIDLTNVNPGQQVTASFTLNREAAYNNFGGLYTVDQSGDVIGKDGSIAAYNPSTGKSTYAQYDQAAVSNMVQGINLVVGNEQTVQFNSTLTGGAIYAPFLIQNDTNTADVNGTSSAPQVWFPFLGANSDNFDHVRLLGNNIFAFEDQTGGGDKDYNDVIIRVNLTANNVAA